MRTGAALPLLVLMAGLSSAQPQASASPSAKPGSMEGVVTNSVNGEPVKKAIVVLQGAGVNRQEITDAAGHFHFDQIDPGSYSVQANRDGFAVARGPQKTIRIAEEETVKDVAVQLVPLAHVSGHVFDEDGDPIMLARIQALRYVFNYGHRRLGPAASATSNDLGEFQFAGLEAGRYIFVVSAPQPVPNLPPRTRFLGQLTTYPTTYYPNGAEPEQATASNLTPGAALPNIDFRLRKVPAFHVRGKVLDSAGQPAHDTNLSWVPDESEMYPGRINAVPIAKDGTFDMFPVVPGTYILSVMRNNRRDSSEAEFLRERISVSDQDLNGVALALSPGLNITGRFIVEGPSPPQINGHVQLHTALGFGQDFQGQVAPDGTFAIQNVWPATYLMDVFTGAPGLYVKSIRYGETDVSSGSLTLTPGGTGALTILFGTDGGQIQGTVQTSSGTPAHGIVTLTPAADLAGRRDLIKHVGTDPAGNFKLADLAPGQYQIFAWEQMPDLVEVPEFRKALASHAASVSIGPNSHESVQVQLISAADADAEKNKLQ